MKHEYEVTSLAGPKIAGAVANPGTGETVHLTEEQAEHPLRLGHVRKPEAVEDAPRGRKRGRRR